jgi:hypothetical protein
MGKTCKKPWAKIAARRIAWRSGISMHRFVCREIIFPKLFL